jgi:putative membrane protein
VACPSAFVEHVHRPVFILFLVCAALNLVLLALQGSTGAPRRSADSWHTLGRWPDGLLLASALVTSMLALGRRLPFQNVITATGLIVLLAGGLLGLTAWTGIPFGPIFFTENAGTKIGDVLPWTLPLWWVVLLLNGRGVARLILRPWRKTPYYGFWVIGFTAALLVAFDLGLEPFAVFVRDYWLWRTPRGVPAWYTAPWVNFLTWFVSASAILVFSVPWLINKNPVKRPMDYHPLIVWLVLNAWLALGNGMHGRWPAVVVTVIAGGITAVQAIRGAHWGAK